jgi:50S ribosomal subunit-associated GTPase HflX
VLKDIGVEHKSEILLLNKIDTPEGEQAYPFWRALHPGALAISAKTGAGLDKLQEAIYRAVRGQQVDVTLQADLANGRLLAFLESHTRIHERTFVGDDGKIRIKAIMGKQTLADLSRNDQVEILSTAPAGIEPRTSSAKGNGDAAWKQEQAPSKDPN